VTRQRKPLVLMLLAIIGTSTVQQVVAAQADKATDKPQETSSTIGGQTSSDKQDSVSNADAKNAGKGATSKKADGVFVPSEEISEDFAVSFPVDI